MSILVEITYEDKCREIARDNESGASGPGSSDWYEDNVMTASELYARYYYEQKTRWIKCSDRLPEINTPVLTQAETGYLSVMMLLEKDNEIWKVAINKHMNGGIYCWQPLPDICVHQSDIDERSVATEVSSEPPASVAKEDNTKPKTTVEWILTIKDQTIRERLLAMDRIDHSYRQGSIVDSIKMDCLPKSEEDKKLYLDIIKGLIKIP